MERQQVYGGKEQDLIRTQADSWQERYDDNATVEGKEVADIASAWEVGAISISGAIAERGRDEALEQGIDYLQGEFERGKLTEKQLDREIAHLRQKATERMYSKLSRGTYGQPGKSKHRKSA